jgi:putative methionine-R-sulfoxide reductase with GAF domain
VLAPPNPLQLFDDLTDLHHAGNVSVMAFVGDEVCCGGSEGALEIGQSVEEKMSNGVIGRRCARRKTANAAVDFSPDKAAGDEQLAREFEVRAEIVVPVEAGARGGGVHHAESNHVGKNITEASTVVCCGCEVARDGWRRPTLKVAA